MERYKHTVQYYETDKMGITHHSNYIRWMEEARVDFLRQIGWDYPKLEALGIASPVVETHCKYKSPTVFADEVFIEVSVEEFKGVKLGLSYKMEKADGTLVCEASSLHCFLNEEGRPMKLSRQFPEFSDALTALVSEKAE